MAATLDSDCGMTFAKFSWFSLSNTCSRLELVCVSGTLLTTSFSAFDKRRLIGERLKLTVELSAEISVGINTKLSIKLAHGGGVSI
jgi:hypothetical protein